MLWSNSIRLKVAKHKLPKIVRLDESDIQVYERVAEPGELAVPGGFEFLDDSVEKLQGKRLQAFLTGFLGIESLGRSTLVAIASVDSEEYQNAINQLSVNILSHFGAPDRSSALKTALEEIRYAESLCEYDEGTVLALEREFTDEEIKESFKKFVPATEADWERSKPLVYSFDENP